MGGLTSDITVRVDKFADEIRQVRQFATKHAVDTFKVDLGFELIRHVRHQKVVEESSGFLLGAVADGEYVGVLHDVQLPEPVQVERIRGRMDDVCQRGSESVLMSLRRTACNK